MQGACSLTFGRALNVPLLTAPLALSLLFPRLPGLFFFFLLVLLLFLALLPFFISGGRSAGGSWGGGSVGGRGTGRAH